MSTAEFYPDGFMLADRFTAAHEGGWADSPWDRGGKTAYGISSVYWPERKYAWYWLQGGGPTPDKARQFRYMHFYQAHGVDRFPDHYQALLYDQLIHHSPRAAIRILQRGLGVTSDGIIGPQTIGAAERSPGRIMRVVAKRSKYFSELLRDDHERNQHNIDGWLWRAHCAGLYATGILHGLPINPYGQLEALKS